MNKKMILSLIITLTIIMQLLVPVVVLGNTITTEKVTIEQIKKDICTIELGKDGKLTKKLTSLDKEKKEINMQVEIENLKKEESKMKDSEIMIVLDNSKSMIDNKVIETQTRKEAVFSAAKILIEKILKEESTIKIGVVTFSSNENVEKEGTIEDANLLTKPISDYKKINTAIDGVKATGARTNIDAGLKLAKDNFSKDTNAVKYIILLTDGIPNNSIGTKMLYSGVTRDNTKKTLQSIVDEKINVISVMTGINSEYKPDPEGNLSAEAKGKTYKDLAEEIFGTVEKPNFGKFHYILDKNIQNTITESIYKELQFTVKNEIKDIIVKDYFPKEIIENYDFELVTKPANGEVTATVNKEDNSITWTIGNLKAEEKASFTYKLKLKKEINEKIIKLETPTNEKVDVFYTGTDTKARTETSKVSPSVQLDKPDETKAPDPIPQTGDNKYLFILSISALAIIAIVAIKKVISYK